MTDQQSSHNADGLYGRLIRLLGRRYHLETAQLTPDATFADLGLDSLAVEELLFIMPDVFGITTDEIPERGMTLGQLADWLRERGARS
ncbi:phosphopantetheine-binding protein [Streptomyces virginiae]|uniref:phosphopantetheine-binding protein n=1 Tax=Streptomyces virginiae TaxID=1961 RepID=UPI0022506F8F|nr:phosphopantetheine-binding protein [Streptomyces virginiae]MCX4961239.1 phosphopantetheine-binding protein [Streptomyces virginiae]